MLKCVRESLIPQIFTAQQQHSAAVFVANLRLGRDEEGFSICHRRLNQLKHLTICITLNGLKPTKSKNRRCQSSGKHSNLRGEIFPEVYGRLIILRKVFCYTVVTKLTSSFSLFVTTDFSVTFVALVTFQLHNRAVTVL